MTVLKRNPRRPMIAGNTLAGAAGLLLLLGSVTAAVPDPVEDLSDDTGMHGTEFPREPEDSHADRQADMDLMIAAVHDPERLMDKTLVFETGETVGPVLDVRKWKQNEDLYLIVDASEFFNTETQFAVAVRDVDRMEDGLLIMPEDPGMHLRGMEYYADDYVAPDEDP